MRELLAGVGEDGLVLLPGYSGHHIALLTTFLYHGEVKVARESFHPLLRLGRELQVKGLPYHCVDIDLAKLDSKEILRSAGKVESSVQRLDNSSSDAQPRRTIRLSRPRAKQAPPYGDKVVNQVTHGFEDMISQHSKDTADSIEHLEQDGDSPAQRDRDHPVKRKQTADSENTGTAVKCRKLFTLQEQSDIQHQQILFTKAVLDPTLPRRGNEDRDRDPILKMFSVRVAGGWTCSTCGSFSHTGNDMKIHIQSSHMAGFGHTCASCGKSFRTRGRLLSHIDQDHSIREFIHK